MDLVQLGLECAATARDAIDSRSRGRSRSRSALLLLTGPPGVGKTTCLRRVAERLAPRRVGGFLTDELRERGVRVGFRIVPFAGEARTMARVDLPSPVRVGRYGVDVRAIDEVAEAALAPDPSIECYLIDEIGKMECLSQRFVAALNRLLDEGERPVAATVARGGGGPIAEVRRRPAAELWEVTVKNRELLVERAVAWIVHRLGVPPPAR